MNDKPTFAETDNAAAHALDNVRKEIEAAMEPAVKPLAEMELDRFLATAERLLATQRKRLIDAENAYRDKRIRLLGDHNTRLAQFEHELEDELHSLDAAHDREVATIKRMIDKLTAMRS